MRPLTAAIALAASVATRDVAADPYRLRADAFAEAPNTSGFVSVSAESASRGDVLVDAEALVWTGAVEESGEVDARGEAVLAAVRVRDPLRRGEVRFGRLLYAGGAVRPLHLDGAVVGAHFPGGTGVEVFGGIPVRPAFRGRSYDWLVGQRFAQEVDEVGRLGISYFQERDEGRPAREELGLDATVFPLDPVLVGGTVALDVLRTGLAEARVGATLHDGHDRLELFALRRSPSRMLPATSLFAAIGAYDADVAGLSGSLRVAPRLDVYGSATFDVVAEQLGATQLARAELRLDDAGRGAIGVEARRVSLPETAWTGGRTWLRLPVTGALSASSELELAVPDAPRDRGVAWPWGLLALRYAHGGWLEASGAVEASATPAYAAQLGALLRVSGTWGEP